MISGRIKILLIGMLIAIALTGCLSNIQNPGAVNNTEIAAPTYTPGTDPDQKYVTYDGGTFKIDFPETWTVEDKESYTVNVVFKAPEPGQTPSSFLPTVNVLITDVNDINDFDEYINNVVDDLKINFFDFSLSDKHFPGENRATLIYTGSLSGFKVKCKQAISIKNDKLCIVTYVSEDKSYDIYLNTANRMIDSLDF